jgi:hypothetical protein
MGMFKNTLSKDQIAQLLYLEVISEGIELAEDEDLKNNIILDGAESILQEIGTTKDLYSIVDSIKNYILDTKHNYPNYFKTGENK